MYKYALLFALAGGAALFTGCRADEEVDLAGYPETPVGATISGTTDRVATFAGTYDNEGVLNLAGSLSGEYTIALAQASPEETVVRVEPIITNVPAELVEISARELVIPAGSTTAAVSVRMIEENYDFMENVFGPVTYELGVRGRSARFAGSRGGRRGEDGDRKGCLCRCRVARGRRGQCRDFQTQLHRRCVAILFLMFDVETVFLFAWAVVVQEIGVFGLVSALFFLLILTFGLAYAWRKGALEWK